MGSIPITRSLLADKIASLGGNSQFPPSTPHQVWIGSSTAEQGAHNSLVTGSNPVRSTGEASPYTPNTLPLLANKNTHSPVSYTHLDVYKRQLLLRNVMLTQTCIDEDDDRHDDELGYGKFACFSEHPIERRNWISQIGIPLFRKGALSCLLYTSRCV